VPVGDADAMAGAILETLETLPPTSATHRAARPPLRAAEPERFAAIFRSVVDSSGRKTTKGLE